jgi:hypothetical protein
MRVRLRIATATNINKMMQEAEGVIGTEARATAWANIDKELVNQAVAVPYDFDKQAEIKSKDVAGDGDLWNEGSWDYNFSSLK